MTINEKVAQLGSRNSTELMGTNGVSNEKIEKLLKNGIGQITRIGGALNTKPEDTARNSNNIQKFLSEQTRLGIPAIMHEECLSGYTARNATVFPQIIGIASTWEPDLVERMTSVIQKQMRSVGAHQGLSPVLDIARDPRWGRTEETYGEDPYLVSKMGVSYVKGLQGDSFLNGVIATAKHFLGYGLTQGGRNWGPSLIPKRELLEVFAKPFEAAVNVANIGSIMNSYSEIDGLVCGFSYEILTELLRNQMGFNGMVVSDYGTIALASRLHRIESDPTKAAIRAIKAGLDVELPTTVGFNNRFVKAVEKGILDEKVVDQAVGRILTKKFELGLFENPYVEENKKLISEIYNSQENRDLAKKIALKSIVLLKNERNLLPLKKSINSLAIIGPNADSVRNLMGDYTFLSQFEAEATNITGYREKNPDQQLLFKDLEELGAEDFARKQYDMKSMLEAIQSKISNSTKIRYAKGCDLIGDSKSGFEEAINAANESEVVIIVVGEKAGLVQDCTSGESRDRSKLTLTGVQGELIQEIFKTDKPIILVLINARPLAISWEKENIPAIIEAWLPGEMGAEAVADVIFGDYNPGGKLPISFPRSVGQIPLYHYQKPTGNLAVWTWNYVEENTTPLFPFGYGLSYTQFEYSNLRISKQKVNTNEIIDIALDLKNTGKVQGEEVVQVYFQRNEVSVTRPIEELVGFKRVSLKPGQTATVTFSVSMRQLGFYNEKMEYVIEPGMTKVYIGSIHSNFSSKLLQIGDLFSQKDVKLKGQFEVTGETVKITTKKVFFSDVKVSKS